jgi:hypothetical protein
VEDGEAEKGSKECPVGNGHRKASNGVEFSYPSSPGTLLSTKEEILAK